MSVFICRDKRDPMSEAKARYEAVNRPRRVRVTLHYVVRINTEKEYRHAFEVEAKVSPRKDPNSNTVRTQMVREAIVEVMERPGMSKLGLKAENFKLHNYEVLE